jgi:hypothetical protein
MCLRDSQVTSALHSSRKRVNTPAHKRWRRRGLSFTYRLASARSSRPTASYDVSPLSSQLLNSSTQIVEGIQYRSNASDHDNSYENSLLLAFGDYRHTKFLP